MPPTAAQIGLALLLSAAAGLATTFGAVLGVVVRRPGSRFMAGALGFSAGVMLLVSFAELLAHATETLGLGRAHLLFFGGFLTMFLIDVLVPHDFLSEHCGPGSRSRNGGPEAAPADPRAQRLMRTGVLVALGLGIHNFPEGLATFAGTLQSTGLGAALAVAIAVHNIPEGLAVAAPIYAATGSRRQAFLWSFFSGVAEPVGAGLAALLLFPFLTPVVLSALLALVAGFMVFVTLDELVPASREYGHAHLTIMTVLAGMAVMSLSLWLFQRAG
jgi:ZIP family zinc transporter